MDIRKETPLCNVVVENPSIDSRSCLICMHCGFQINKIKVGLELQLIKDPPNVSPSSLPSHLYITMLLTF